MSFKNKNIIRQFPFFTHFACIPLFDSKYRQLIQYIQTNVQMQFQKYGFEIETNLRRHSNQLSHITMFMLTLKREEIKKKMSKILESQEQILIKKLSDLLIRIRKISYFTRFNKNQKCEQITVVYLEIDEQSTKILNQIVDYLVRILLRDEIILNQQLKDMRIVYDHREGKFNPQTFHISLFRCKNMLKKEQFLNALEKMNTWLEELNSKQKIELRCKNFDISTMMEFDQNRFYRPLKRIDLQVESQNQQIRQQRIE